MSNVPLEEKIIDHFLAPQSKKRYWFSTQIRIAVQQYRILRENCPLTDKQKIIIALYYFCNDGKGYPMDKIGKILGISRQAVSLQHEKALRKYREYWESHQAKKKIGEE